MGLRLSLLALAVVAFVPLAHAAPPQAGTIKLALGPITGLVVDGGASVVPYAGNVTVAATVTMDCSLILYEYANKTGSDIDHFHVEPADETLPPWLIADEFLTDFPPPAAGAPAIPLQQCQDGAGSYSQVVQYPFGVSAAAPGAVPLKLNLTANLGDDAFSEPVAVSFTVQFHPGYTLTPSAKFPFAINGTVPSTPANFTLTVRNTSNADAMVMFQEVKASSGVVSGLKDVVIAPGKTATLPVTFTGPTACWSTASVNATAVIMPNSGAGAVGSPQHLSWTFTHGSCSTKKSPAPGFLLAFATLGLAAVARRRRDE